MTRSSTHCHRLAEIAAALGAELAGDGSIPIRGAAEPAEAGPDHLALALTDRFRADLGKGRARAALLPEGADWQALGLEGAVLVARPRYAMAGLTALYETLPDLPAGIHPTAIIHPDAEIGEGAAIGPFVVIGPKVRIGRGARIMAHCSIGDETVIGDELLLHPGVRIGRGVTVGHRFRAHANTVIGADGFSFVTPEPDAVEAVRRSLGDRQGRRQGRYARIASLGRVVIGDDVEFGAGCTVDRGTISATVIGDGSKFDNLVHVGHNVRIGRDCAISGQCGFAGSARIGDRVVMGGQCGVGDHVVVGDDVIAGGATKMFTNVPKGRVVLGSPAVKMEQHVEMYKALRRLPRLMRELLALRARLGEKVDGQDG